MCDNNRTFCYRPSLVACSGNYNWWAVKYGQFFSARRYAKCGVCRRRVSVRLSVCVYVTFRYCIKTAKRRITQIMPHDRVFKWVVLKLQDFYWQMPRAVPLQYQSFLFYVLIADLWYLISENTKPIFTVFWAGRATEWLDKFCIYFAIVQSFKGRCHGNDY